LPLRIFLSSPGDVTPERLRAVLVVRTLAKEFARYFEIVLESWDTEPMLASGHFQDNIIPPSKTDIVIVILWSRLGTPLPERTEVREYRGIDGRVPVTGTEWEFEDALAASRASAEHIPDLLVYSKKAPPSATYRSEADLHRLGQQWAMLEAFWGRYFVKQGEFRAAFTDFITRDDFETRLESDLRRLIERRIARSSEAPRTWLKEPFLGLSAYSFEHAPIFFGRRELTTTAVERISHSAEEGRAFLLILGASGSGKSSLAQAGVLPALVERGVIPMVGLWRYAVFRPSGDPAGLFALLARALVGATALPELLASGQDETSLARHLAAAADDPTYPIAAMLNELERTARGLDRLLNVETARLAVIVDQLEELFTAHEHTAEERRKFVRCLDGLARSGRVFVIATMRSDHWHRAAETPLLVDMADEGRRIDLLPPSRVEISEMIRRPAQAAGISFEREARKEVGLDADLSEEAAQEPGSLPLLSFLLNALYLSDIRWPDRSTLTYASMRALGGLRGAIAQRADEVLAALPPDAQAALPKVLRALVTVSRSDDKTTARAAPLATFVEGSPERRLVESLLAARLLVAHGDASGPQIRLAHEALITNWGLAQKQIVRDRDDLRTRAEVEVADSKFSAASFGQRGYLLRDPELANALDLARRWGNDLPPKLREFIERSDAAARAAARRTIALLAGTALVFLALATFSLIQWRAAALHTQAYALFNAASVQNELSQSTVALSSYRSALALFVQVGDLPRQADSLYRIGRLEKKIGRYPDAIQHLRQALALHQKLLSRGDAIYDYMSLSDGDILVHRPLAAIDDAKRGLMLAPKNAKLTMNLAHGYLFSGDLARAKALYLEHAADDNFTFGDDVLLDLGRYQAAGIHSPYAPTIERLLKTARARR
jgi:tetratricopeptide (TPR) repeat protein/energy-coupling factor transporter ATP-binding protein EcfA2